MSGKALLKKPKSLELKEVQSEKVIQRMIESVPQTELELGEVIKGVEQVVPTRHGPLRVTCHGDVASSPCITYHDVGLRHSTCFQSLLLCSSSTPLLLKNFCFYHITAPGSEEGDVSLPSEIKPMTIGKLADQVEDVMRFFNLSEVVGLGVGCGGSVLAKSAARKPQKFSGLILASPPCSRPGWWEWCTGQVALQTISWSGLNASVQDYLVRRLLKHAGPSQDLAYSLKRDYSTYNPEGIAQYLSACLHRQDLSDDFKRLQCRVLLFTGSDSIYRHDSLHINTLLDHSRSSWLEIESSGCLVTEERPYELLSSIKLFLAALQSVGFGLNWALD